MTFTIPNAIEQALTISRVLTFLTKGKLIPHLRKAVIEDERAWTNTLKEDLENCVSTLRGK